MSPSYIHRQIGEDLSSFPDKNLAIRSLRGKKAQVSDWSELDRSRIKQAQEMMRSGADGDMSQAG
jgi:hypothetical protein